jgi:hypothetical protein
MIANIEAAIRKGGPPIYDLKIVLLHTKPLVWRRLQVPGNANLGWLHAVLQVAMGWTNSHLHHFLTRDARYSDPGYNDNEDSGFGGLTEHDENEATVLEVLPKAGAHITYEYDFGDSWLHSVEAEKILPPAAKAAGVAVCLDGARAGPPEDCGGVSGYANFLEIMKNRKHPDHQNMKEWIGGSFDAEAFDVAEVNAWLRKLKWPRVTEAQLRRVLMARDGYSE